MTTDNMPYSQFSKAALSELDQIHAMISKAVGEQDTDRAVKLAVEYGMLLQQLSDRRQADIDQALGQ
ncbi:hypothetical protein FHT86_002123 [Rhizobium sp. BK313]|uniref:hypothetical protein n=1 Tax=Rhizobium sp. BK313 TaxID=2587081 RepID=UPI0016072ECA|nr:hypothetical protein [Rhizobium sp. BK313]MBB3453867.1 hypothetical protein [Rhizobium sp. BK313]